MTITIPYRWCNNPFAEYSTKNGAQLTVVGQDLVVGFRGSSTLRDIVSDLQIGPSVGPLGVRCHRGFLGALNTVDHEEALFKDISGVIAKHGIKRVVLSGTVLALFAEMAVL